MGQNIEGQKHSYSAADIQILEPIEAVRLRPGMYVGTLDQRGLVVLLAHAIFGLSHMYNFLGQTLGQLTISFEQDGSATMICSGPTLDEAFLEQLSPLLLRELHEGPKRTFLYAISALSERLSMTARATHGQWRTLLLEPGTLRSDESHAVAPDPNCDIWLRFWPDFTILEPAAFNYQLTQRMIYTSFPKISNLITLIDARS